MGVGNDVRSGVGPTAVKIRLISVSLGGFG